MRDIDIRLALDSRLRGLDCSDANMTIRHEFGLQEGRRRIDVVMVTNHLSGWEIKSDVDTLARLADQGKVYGKVLDFVSIVTTNRYADRATAMLPDWWGVIVAKRHKEQVQLAETRAATFNSDVDPMSLAQLLWRDEAMALLREVGEDRGLSSKARWYVWSRLIETVPLEQLRHSVREQIKARQGWPGGQLSLPHDVTFRTLATA